MASKLGYEYVGIELRPEQIEANQQQAASICQNPLPLWIQGDSSNLDTLWGGAADMIFTCPPYGNLETYSDDPRDLSGMMWDSFESAYEEILVKSVRLLKDSSFLAMVVGNFRDKKTGQYRNLVRTTDRIMEKAGVQLYTEAIIVTAVGSATIRAPRSFDAGRKITRTHQHLVVYLKGDPKRACSKLGPVR